MSALDDVVKWAEEDIPKWQSDAVRRLLSQDELKDKDITEILAMLKENHGLIDPNNPAPKPQPLTKGKISGSAKKNLQIILKWMGDLVNINAIPVNSYIPFAHEGLTVIYGENGTGKSGYARVLKRACNARDTKEMIHPNVFQPLPLSPASATFKVSIDNGTDKEEKDIKWVDGQKDETLGNITVFDSKSARVIIDEDNDVSFVPYGTQVFEQLISLLKQLRLKLTEQCPKPVKLEYEDIPVITKAGQDLSGVSSKTTTAEVEQMVDWSDENKLRLKTVIARIGELESPNLKKNIQRLRNLEILTKELAENVKRIDENLSSVAHGLLNKRIEEIRVAETAFNITAKQSSDTEPLPGVGSAVWQKLYFAAKDYSENEAYTGQSFPFTDVDCRCVLCMQPLLSEGKGRLLRFKEFMEQTTKKNLEKAQSILDAILAPIKLINFDQLNINQDLIQEMCDRDASIGSCIMMYATAMQERAKQFISEIQKKELVTLSEIKPSPIESIKKLQTIFSTEAKKLEEGLNPEELRNLKIERKELEARERLSTKKVNILQNINELKLVDKYKAALADTDFINISKKGKDIISDALTPELKRALSDELKELGADYLKLDTKPTGSGGKLFNKLTFLKAKLPNKTMLTDILSEGEQRVVAIAGFLAELGNANHNCPIVFDDPVSSLDHKYRNKIAQRLAKEAKKRQVIVFTHDIAFLIGLKESSLEIGTIMEPQTILKTGDVLGRSAKGSPWHTMIMKERFEYLRNEHTKLKDMHGKDNVEYNRKTATFYAYLREAWEAAVEQALLNNTIKPHAPGVYTMNLRAVEVTTEDYKSIDIGMAKCSKWMNGHKSSEAIDVNRPDPKDCERDIQNLVIFTDTINKRKDTTRKMREAALEPPRSSVG